MFFFYASIALAAAFIFITGFHDEGNLIATIITSRSLNIYIIFLLASISQFLGTLFLGTKVALGTVRGLLNIDLISQASHNSNQTSLTVCAALLGAIVWNIITWIYQIPSSSSHAIVGGLLGSFVLKYGIGVINIWGLIFFVLLPLFTSPVIGYILGFAILKINMLLCRILRVKSNKFFKLFQILTCVVINAFQGSNDAQKGMGIIALLLMLNYHGDNLVVPSSAILLSALIISIGLIFGGLKMIKSVGTKIYSVKSIHSMSAQISSAFVIISASQLGFPISGTQIVNSAILGVGAADRPNAVGWKYAKSMLVAWAITIPATFLLSAVFYQIFSQF